MSGRIENSRVEAVAILLQDFLLFPSKQSLNGNDFFVLFSLSRNGDTGDIGTLEVLMSNYASLTLISAFDLLLD